MKQKGSKFIYWTPRILSIIFIFFMALMSLDVISPGLSFSQIIAGLIIHNIPAFILLVILIISWKYEIVGGIAFILFGIGYIGIMIRNALIYQFKWYMVSWSIEFAGIAFFIGILFLLGWSRKRK